MLSHSHYLTYPQNSVDNDLKTLRMVHDRVVDTMQVCICVPKWMELLTPKICSCFVSQTADAVRCVTCTYSTGYSDRGFI